MNDGGTGAGYLIRQESSPLLCTPPGDLLVTPVENRVRDHQPFPSHEPQFAPGLGEHMRRISDRVPGEQNPVVTAQAHVAIPQTSLLSLVGGLLEPLTNLLQHDS